MMRSIGWAHSKQKETHNTKKRVYAAATETPIAKLPIFRGVTSKIRAGAAAKETHIDKLPIFRCATSKIRACAAANETPIAKLPIFSGGYVQNTGMWHG